MKISAFIVLVLFTCVSTSQEFYKCENKEGVIFSQQPCGDNAEQITSIHKKTVTPNPDRNGQSSKLISKSPEEDMLNVKIYTVNKQISKHNSNITTAKRKMTREIKLLKARTVTANNNLAGAIYQDALSEEMIAVSNKYTAIIADEERRIISLKSQVSNLKNQLSKH